MDSPGEPARRTDWLDLFVIGLLCAGLFVLALLMAGCRAAQGLAIGGVAGAATTGTPQGAAGGAAGGLLVGFWDDVKAWVSGAWSWLTGGSQSASAAKGPIAAASASARHEVLSWVLLGALAATLVFIYKKRRWLWSLIRPHRPIPPQANQ